MASVDEQMQAGFLALKGQYNAALTLCESLLKQKELFDLLVIKAVCLQKLGQFKESVETSEDAILSNPTRYEGFFHQGVGLFHRGEFKSAMISLMEAKQKTQSMGTKNKISDWQRKCKAEVDGRHLKDFLEESVPTPHQVFNNAAIPNPVHTNIPQNYVVSATGKISYTWYQTNLQVGIEIVHGLSQPNKLRTNFESQKFDCSFPIGEGRTFDLSLDLFDEIDPTQSYAKVGLSQIDFHLQKKNPNNFWKSLQVETEEPTAPPSTSTEQDKEVLQPVIPAAAAADPQHSYPTSSKKKKDWDKIDKEIEIDMHKNRDEYASGDSAMEMFKWIYQGSDEDTRRAMLKSFQQSGGKALSTNWKEVKEKDYKGKDRLSPPKGMIEKDYEY